MLESIRGAAVGWRRYCVDSLCALISIGLLTGLIFFTHLYPIIPDSFLIYLLVILALAGFRGLYASLLASLLAFFLFDFLLIPPVYSLTVEKFADVLTLIVFLVTAILTSQLASALRRRAEDANHRERQTRLLYNILRATNREEDMAHQLTVLARSIVEIYTRQGIRDCAFLLLDEDGELTPQVSAVQPLTSIASTEDERINIKWVQSHARSIDFCGILQQQEVESPLPCKVRLMPLMADQRVVGILQLCSVNATHAFPLESSTGKEECDTLSQDGLFFSALLEQAVTMIEQGRLRRESLHMKLLQQTDALRAALLSSVSHDLRTPLSTIKTSATSLLQEHMGWDQEARRGFASAIVRETDRLNGLVENLLDMSRIEAGALHPEKVWYPLDELVRDVLDHMQAQLAGRALTVRIPEDLPPVELDSMQMNQVLTNIVENACNHTPHGSPIDVTLSFEKRQVRVCIADRGPGVPADEQERIFDKFYRVLGGVQTNNASRGSGLGLAICRAFIEAHEGRIWVESRAGGGAVFCFTLPLSEIGDDL